MKLTQRQQKIMLLIIQRAPLQSSKILELLIAEEDISLITVKRELAQLTNAGYLKVQGVGRSTAYEIAAKGRLFVEIIILA